MIRQDNIQLSSDKQEFQRLYKPLGEHYLRNEQSYLYFKDKKPVSSMDYQSKLGLTLLGTQPVNIALPLPANASPAQIQEWVIRTQAYSNPRVDTGIKAPDYHSGQQTGGVNREMVNHNGVGMVYNSVKVNYDRTPQPRPIY